MRGLIPYLKIFVFLPFAVLILFVFQLFYKINIRPREKCVIFFQRREMVAFNDAGSRTVDELKQALSEKIDISSVSLNKIDIRFFSALNASRLCFVRSPEDAVVLCFLKIVSFKRCGLMYYGGDIHHQRVKSKIEFEGLTKINAIEFVYYYILEPLIWKASYCNFSPSLEEQKVVQTANTESYVLPVRMFNDFPTPKMRIINKKKSFLFVGSVGHLPNLDVLKYIDTEIIDAYSRSLGYDFEILIVGQGWEPLDYNHSGTILNFLGRVSDDELVELYNTVDFTLCPIRFGAGVKGKIIESMYYNVPVITTAIGVQGIECDELVAHKTIASQIQYIKSFENDPEMQIKTAKGYSEYLKKKYSRSKIRTLVFELI